MRTTARVTARASLLALALALAAAPALAAGEPRVPKGVEAQLQKPVKMLIGAIRYKKDDLALKLLALEEMTRQLCLHHLTRMSPAQKKEFEQHLGALLQKISFVKARELFAHIDAILYDPPSYKPGTGDRELLLRSTIVVHRAYKKQELVLTWTLIKGKKGWLILDVTTAKVSTLESLREEQIDPLVKEGGVALLLKKMREKLAELK